MKKLYTLLILAGCSLYTYSQQQAVSFTLNQPLSGSGHHYQALEYIDMDPGFEYEAQNPGEEFIAELNPLLVFPPDEGITGGPNEGDKGLVGATPGTFAVSETGQATYVIPLEFPGGIGGMTPDLSLIYNSNGGDGILGPGWSLGGLSVINLVPANRYYDGIIEAANGADYSQDAYTLDGQRLILVNDDGNNNLTFRTEQDVFSKILRSNIPPEKPEGRDLPGKQFKVQTKSGLTYFYGERNADDSRLRHKIGTKYYTIAYYVNRIADNFGNEINFKYRNIVGDAASNTLGEIYIDYIEYTKNDSAQQQQQPIYRIKFNYTDRHSPLLTYYNYQPAHSSEHPIAFKTAKLIADIECIYIPDNSVVKHFELDYIDRGPGNNTANKTKHLASIQEFGLNGEEEYNKTVFEWEEEMDYNSFESLTVNIPQSVKTSWGSPFSNQSIVRDVEYQLVGLHNDKEIVIIRTYEWISRISTSDWTHDVTHKIVIEFIKRLNESDFELINYMEIPYQTYQQVLGKPLSQGKFFVSTADFTGNGWNDLLINKWRYSRENNIFGFKGVDVVLYLNDENGSFNEHNVYNHTSLLLYNYVADFNGDGIADLLLQNRNATTNSLIWRLGSPNNPLSGNIDSSNGQELIYNPQDEGLHNPLQIVDFNGDGRSEIMRRISANQYKIYYLIPDNADNITFKIKDINSSKTLCYLNKDRKIDGVSTNLYFDYDPEYYQYQGVEGSLNLNLFYGTGHGFYEYGSQSFDLGPLNDDCRNQYNWDRIRISGFTNLYGIDFSGNGAQDFILKIELLYEMEFDLGQGNFNEYECSEFLYYILITNTSGTGFELYGPYYWLEQYVTEDGIKIADINGDNQQDLYRIISNEGNADEIEFRMPSPHGSRINRITNGMGAVTKIEYAYSSDPDVYTPGAEVEFPVIPYEANQALVKRVERDNGQDGFFGEKYHYEKARAHTEGLGYLGFEKTIRNDVTRGIVHTTEYALNTYFYYTYPKELTISTTGGDTLKKTINTYAHIATGGLHDDKFYYYVHPETSTTLYYELGQSYPYKGERITYTGFDSHGNPGIIKTEYGPYTGSSITYTHSTQIVHEYYEPTINSTNWILGRLKDATTTFKAPNTPDIIRKASFEYYTDGKEKGMLKKEITEPDNPLYRVVKEYVYDDYGNILTTKIHAPSLGHQHDRTTTTTYKDGRFVDAITNSEQHTSGRVYEAKLGLLLQETDPNNFTTAIEYNAFGRPQKTIAHDGNQTASALRWVLQGDPTAPPHATYYSWSKSSGSAPVIVYYNKLGMELSTVTVDFGGEAVFVETQYNNKGQVASKSESHKGNAEYFTHFQYDAIGRANTITHPDNSQTQIAYNGLNTSTTNALGQTSQKTVNAAGWLTTSTDAAGGKVRHSYYASGLVESTYVLGHNNSKREYAYDIVGNLVSYSDASQGDIGYQYNAFGELTLLTTPKGVTNYTEYDKLGRLRKRESPEGITTWQYDRPGEKGLLYEEKLVTNENTVHQILYNYDHDNILRLQSVEESIQGEDFTKSFAYDIFGRPVKKTFPSGYAVEYDYNEQGYQNKVIEAGTGSILWEAKNMNERNQFSEINLGCNITQVFEYFDATGRIKKIQSVGLQNNTYTWDAIGNLKTRNTGHSITETFQYDNLNRLHTILHNGTIFTTLQYDALGNITYKFDVGDYTYDASNPYKLNSISNRPSTINADNQHIEYNSFNKVTQITEEDPVTGIIIRQLDLVYGTGNQRVLQQMQNGQNFTTKYYVGSDYEVENKDGAITRVHYIFTPSGLAAIVKRDEQNNDVLNFVLNDHLGSVQVLANAAGQLLEEFSYDPWGLRRNPVTLEVYAWAAMPVTGMDYGFTGHEHLDIFMLVNMNGRIYDPGIGRFLSPDPVLQFPNFTQGLNPYAYALNNPLRFVDPDGYSLAGQIIATSLVIAFSAGNPLLGALIYSVVMTIDYAIEQGRNVNAGDLFGYFTQTFVMSAISMGVTQGIGNYMKELGTAGKSAIELRRALAHGTFNGAMRFAQGGKFEHGFLSGFVSSLGGSFIQANADNMSLGAKVSMSAVIGGTAEKLGGGKFANGAVTGAYVMMFNHLGQLHNKSLYDEGKTSFTIRKSAFLVPEIGDPLFGYLGAKYTGLINVNYCDVTGNYILELAISGTAFTTEDFSPNLILRTELIENGNIIQTNSSAGYMPRSAIVSGASTHKNLGLASGRILLPEFSQNLSLQITVGFNYGTANGNWVYPNASYIHTINQTRTPHYLNPK